MSKVETVMREYKKGKLHSGTGKEGEKGKKVKDKDQAIAIALSEAREAGEDIPEKKAYYTQLLSKEQREECIRNGLLLKLAEYGVTGETLEKEAGLVGDWFDTGAKGIILGSVITGIPLGIMAHMVHRKTREVRNREKELQSKINYYNQAAQDLETGLAGSATF
jgi:hypothetical protein